MKKISLIILIAIQVIACKKDNLNDLSDIFTVRRNNADLMVRVYGNGSSKKFILVLHGGPGGSGTMYRIGTYAKELEKDYAMIYMDQRGQGQSQGQYDKEDLSMASLSADVAAVARVIKNNYGNDIQLILYGHSWGGMIGTATVINPEYQGLFAAWIESNGVHDYPTNDQGTINLFNKVGPEQIALGNSVSYWTEVLDEIKLMDTLNLTYDNRLFLNDKAFEADEKLIKARLMNPAEVSLYGASLWGGNPLNTFWSGLSTNLQINEENKLDKLSYTNQLHNITIPTLLMYAKYDFVVPPISGTQAYEKISSSNKKLVLFEKSGHSTMFNEPDLYISTIKDFINGL